MSTSQPQNLQSLGSYIYAVGYAEPFQGPGASFQTRGIAGLPVRTASLGDLAAIVSDSPSDQYDVTIDLVTAHENVIEEAMKRSDILPVSFGTVAGSDQEVKERLLQAEFDDLHEQLQHVKNRVELGVKALWEQSFLFAQILAEDPRIQALRDQIVGTTPEQTYDTRLQLGELTDAAIQRRRQQDAQVFLNALSPLAVETRTNDIITDMMILNASFLVDKSQVPSFESAVSSLTQATQGQAIVQYTGPLPPYNFVQLTIHWEEPSGAIAL